jgi:hydroxymethylpyrimidine pyrophosphatase-like HAD family hydrolase
MTSPEPGWTPELVALDLDGTLVGPDDTVTPRVAAAVTRAARSAPMVLATGRSLHATEPVSDRLGLDDVLLVCSNGAVLAHRRAGASEVVETVTFDARPAVDLVRTEVPEALFAVEELGLGYRVTAPFPNGELTGDMQVSSLEELVANPVTRVVVRAPQYAPHDFLDLVERIGLHGVNYAVGYTAWLDLAPAGVSKASALESARRRLGVRASGTLAVGDGRNDLEMLAWAAHSVAMGQAPPAVQDAADEVTFSFDDDGVAVVLERWFPPSG